MSRLLRRERHKYFLPGYLHGLCTILMSNLIFNLALPGPILERKYSRVSNSLVSLLTASIYPVRDSGEVRIYLVVYPIAESWYFMRGFSLLSSTREFTDEGLRKFVTLNRENERAHVLVSILGNSTLCEIWSDMNRSDWQIACEK